MLSHHPLITASDRLYFAYASNLSPEKMAHRCPDSIFLGKATLRGHRWQINERGVANVVRTGRQRDAVEGLVYAISPSDEERLDRYEGVSKELYEKVEAKVDFESVRENVFARCTSASVAKAVREERESAAGGDRRVRSWDERRPRRDLSPRGRRRASGGSAATGGLTSSILGLLGVPRKADRTVSPPPARVRRGRERERSRDEVRAGRTVPKPVIALVYASTLYSRDGDVRERYVPRMERAMDDAVALGVSRDFIDRHIAPQVWRSQSSWKSSWRMSLPGVEGLGAGRRVTEIASKRSVSQSDGSGRRGRRESVVSDRHRDY
ncbi:ig2 family protein [Diaporthe amygdali]|uniref:ig2 family protein n=1 Tax=Phomopsis amygdali TaxID=1214568 RepID=UPI0022FDE85A|nr:ig2 family protein [Diaporthe amygdali]KAJ0117766.1 ig2 family protein [Diaporthe amygdali]